MEIKILHDSKENSLEEKLLLRMQAEQGCVVIPHIHTLILNPCLLQNAQLEILHSAKEMAWSKKVLNFASRSVDLAGCVHSWRTTAFFEGNSLD